MRRALPLLMVPIAAIVMADRAHHALGGGKLHAQHEFTIIEATIPELQEALEKGEVTSKALVELYLSRIERYEGALNAVISVNPHAKQEAEKLDRERADGLVRGPLHGIPIALKDNIHTRDMPTTGGALAFKDLIPPYEATLTTKLRRAGAIIIAKTVLTELANWVTAGMPTNYSAVGGFGFNPYDPRPDPRSVAPFNDGRPVLATGGSSSGIGTAANLWAANIGTETSGSILSPASATMLVGIKPTVGRVSGRGVIPIVADQDIAGPLARTVTDAAILLSAIEGFDPLDPATTACSPVGDYRSFLRRAGLQGARIGIPRANYYEAVTPPGASAQVGGLNAAQLAVMNEAIQILRQEGATVIDPTDIPSVVDGTVANNLLLNATCTTTKAANCSVVLAYGFKRDFNAWLTSLGEAAPVKTLTELRAFNTANAARGAIKYGQTLLDFSDEMDLTADRARYEADRARDIYLTATHGIGEVMDRNKLDAVLFPSNIGANVAARPGYPSVIVPFGRVPNVGNPPFPDGFNAQPANLGVTFTSTACNEGRLIELAYAFEQATRRRVPPPSAP
jgi:amidase